MSVLHVNQIAGALHRTFDNLIDTSDILGKDVEKHFLSRALAAFSIAQLAGVSPDHAANAVTDGSLDNGIDAIHYDQHSKILYVVQSKWHSDGHGALDRADILKFTKGFGDLTNLAFDRFNRRVRSKEATIREALNNAQATYCLVLVHTGAQDFDCLPLQDLEDTLNHYNDSSNPDAIELLHTRILKQSDIHGMLARGSQGAPIDLEVILMHWGEASDPYAVYGQIAAADIAQWWKKHYPQLVSQNIRLFLGADTDVNIGLQQTLTNEPEHFWHFNNGITVICRDVKRKLISGGTKESGSFTCYDVRIVNGAQTAGSIAAAYEKKPEAVDRARVQVRFITVADGAQAHLGDAITRATNTQNRINRQDFVALDPEQERLRRELSIDGVIYNYKSAEVTIRDRKTTDIEEATVALACAYSDMSLSTLAKREIGRLWEDTSKSPYRALFNPGLTGIKLWQCVRVNRLIDTALQQIHETLEGREEGFVIHGNRFIAHMVFQELPASVTSASSPITSDTDSFIKTRLKEVFVSLQRQADQLFPDAYLAQLFKNQQKLAAIANGIRMIDKF